MDAHRVFTVRSLSQFLFPLLLALNGLLTLIVLIRFPYLTYHRPTLGAVLLLAVSLSLVHLLLRGLNSNIACLSQKNNFALLASPGILLGLALVLPSWNLLYIILFLTVFLLSCCPLNTNLPTESPPISVDQSLSSDKPARSTEEDENEDENEDDGNVAEDICVSMESRRSGTEDGNETLEVSLRVHFTQGVRLQYVHVPFCPGFSANPSVETYQLDGEAVEIILAKLTPFGVRLDLKRPTQRTNQEMVRVMLIVRGEKR